VTSKNHITAQKLAALKKYISEIAHRTSNKISTQKKLGSEKLGSEHSIY